MREHVQPMIDNRPVDETERRARAGVPDTTTEPWNKSEFYPVAFWIVAAILAFLLWPR